MTLRDRVRVIAPEAVTDWFAAGNLGFLAVDIALAHAANNFADPAEWIPVAFSAAAPLLLLPMLLRPGSRAGWWLSVAVATASIAVGIAGMVFHLQSGFFDEQTLHMLVYTAPFVAPLSYVGLGLLLLLNRLERPGSELWGQWVVLLALGGFVGNLGLSLLDHAQNGFFSPLEWIPVVAAAFGTSFLAVALFRHGRPFLRVCLWVMALQAVVGVAGALLHLRADVGAERMALRDRFLYGAPLFAPLLFADLALLGAIGLWALWRVGEPWVSSSPAATDPAV